MDAELALDGFRMFRKDRERDVEQMGGGVLLYIKNNIVVSELNEYRSRHAPSRAGGHCARPAGHHPRNRRAPHADKVWLLCSRDR